jgi:rhodanese-related sulfurtransferase
MRISITKILLIICFAIAVALSFNYLQPNSLPLFNETKSSIVDEKLNSQFPAIDNSEEKPVDSIKEDLNEKAVEKDKKQINDDAKNNDVILSDNSGKNSDNISLSNLTTKVFNQPRLISLAQAYELYGDQILFVDARDSTEYNDGHIAGAINLPYFFLKEYSSRIDVMDKTKPLVTYCEAADCDMSIRLGNELFSKGFRKVFVFYGGWEEWKKAQYPVITTGTNLNLN